MLIVRATFPQWTSGNKTPLADRLPKLKDKAGVDKFACIGRRDPNDVFNVTDTVVVVEREVEVVVSVAENLEYVICYSRIVCERNMRPLKPQDHRSTPRG